MAYKKIAPTYECEAPRMEFVLDTDADLEDLPECGAGSSAISVASGNVFMKNASGAWRILGGGEQ